MPENEMYKQDVEQPKETKAEVTSDTHENLADLAKLVLSSSNADRAEKLPKEEVFAKKAKTMTNSILEHFWEAGKVTPELLGQSEFSLQDQLQKEADASNVLNYGAKQAINVKIPVPESLLASIPVVTDQTDEAQKQKVESYRVTLEKDLLAKAGLPEGYRVFYAKDTKNKSLLIRFLPELRTGQGPRLEKNVMREDFGVAEPTVNEIKPGITAASDALPDSIQEKGKMFYEYLTKEKGLSREHALGLVANAHRESSFSTSVDADDLGANSCGLFQWRAERRTALMNAVPDWKTNWKGQLDFALQENNDSREYLAKSFSTPEEAAAWWTEHWEKPYDKYAEIKKNNKNLSGYTFSA